MSLMITLRSVAKELTGIKDIEGAYIGKDGYYLEKITNEDVSEEQLKNNIRYINTFFNKKPPAIFWPEAFFQ